MRILIVALAAGAGAVLAACAGPAGRDRAASDCGALSANEGAYRMCVSRNREERWRISRDRGRLASQGYLYATADGPAPRPATVATASVGRGALVQEFADDSANRRKICVYLVVAGHFHLPMDGRRACPPAIN